jgi:hypothetical protein
VKSFFFWNQNKTGREERHTQREERRQVAQSQAGTWTQGAHKGSGAMHKRLSRKKQTEGGGGGRLGYLL